MPLRPVVKTESEKPGLQDPPSRISFRTDEKTHRKLVRAAEQANFKSLNAWMEETLSRAAKTILGENESSEVASDSIQNMIQDPEAAVELVRTLAPFLKTTDPYEIIRFNAALKKLLIGLDAVKPLLTDEEIQSLVVEFAPLLKESDSYFVYRLEEALKKLLIGLHAVQDFLKDKQTGMSDVVLSIEGLLKKSEMNS